MTDDPHSAEPNPRGPFHGIVKEWSDDDGWGVLVSPELEGTVFAHFIHIRGQGDGFRTFEDGTPVVFETDGHAGQDGCDHRASWVEALPLGRQPTHPKGVNPKTGKPYEPGEIPVPKRSAWDQLLHNAENTPPTKD
jgi:CspA family cold shock protein